MMKKDGEKSKFEKQSSNRISYEIGLGATDAITAYICEQMGADFLWISSFIFSSIFGEKDNDTMNIENYAPILKSLENASRLPIIFDFGARGRNSREYISQLRFLKQFSLKGICIEDERNPKTNAMVVSSSRQLLGMGEMCKKILLARHILGPNSFIIARTHSLIVNESKEILQDRISLYIKAGADAICLHHTIGQWGKYRRLLDSLKITKPLVLLLSKYDRLPKFLPYRAIKFVVFPNQIYRMMISPILKFIDRNENSPSLRSEYYCANKIWW